MYKPIVWVFGVNTGSISVQKNQHIGVVRGVDIVDVPDLGIKSSAMTFQSIPSKRNKPKREYSYQDGSVDPDDQLTPDQKVLFVEVNCHYASVLSPNFTGYNDASGHARAHVTVDAIPPPLKKARVPSYSHKNLFFLQKADELED